VKNSPFHRAIIGRDSGRRKGKSENLSSLLKKYEENGDKVGLIVLNDLGLLV
jgi:hypothetical protein